MRRTISLVLVLLLFFKTLRAQNPPVIKGKSLTIVKKPLVKYGIASFYAKKFKGRKTSDGSNYSSAKFTAACNKLPLGTWVKVTNEKNKRSVIVKITDHLHHRNKRLIDLSKCAAEKLGFISKGITRVKVEVLGNSQKRTRRQLKLLARGFNASPETDKLIPA